MTTQPCPCGLPAHYDDCCGRFHQQGLYPQKVELLMRSRFSAYVLNDVDYLIKTWHPDTCPPRNELESPGPNWQKLEVLKHKQGLKKGTVHFKAYFLNDQGEQVLEEESLFKRVKNRWVYHSALNF